MLIMMLATEKSFGQLLSSFCSCSLSLECRKRVRSFFFGVLVVKAQQLFKSCKLRQEEKANESFLVSGNLYTRSYLCVLEDSAMETSSVRKRYSTSGEIRSSERVFTGVKLQSKLHTVNRS